MNSNDKKMSISVFTIIAVGIMLPITIFMVNRPLDIRQQASKSSNSQVSPTNIPGCPEKNADGTVNICRPQIKCPLGEIVKEDGNAQCSSRLQKPSICCIHI